MRDGTQVGELRHNIVADQRVELFVLSLEMLARIDRLGGVAWSAIADRRQMAESFPLAMASWRRSRSAADHDILHAQTRPPHIPSVAETPPGSAP